MVIFLPTAAVLLAMSIVRFSLLVRSGREQLSGLTGNTQRSPGDASMLPSFSSFLRWILPLLWKKQKHWQLIFGQEEFWPLPKFWRELVFWTLRVDRQAVGNLMFDRKLDSWREKQSALIWRRRRVLSFEQFWWKYLSITITITIIITITITITITMIEIIVIVFFVFADYSVQQDEFVSLRSGTRIGLAIGHWFLFFLFLHFRKLTFSAFIPFKCLVVIYFRMPGENHVMNTLNLNW